MNEALQRLARPRRAEDGRRDRRHAHPRDVGPPAWPPRSSSPSPASSRRSRACPAIGPKTAQRLTFHLLRAPDAEARTLAAALIAVRDQVVFCERLLQHQRRARSAPSAADPGRDDGRLCVVEEPLDVLALERTGEFRGLYHVLHGAISPIDGIGPERLRIARAHRPGRRGARRRRPFEEVILATNPTLEGEATAMYLAERLAGRRVGHADRPRAPGRRRPRYADDVTLVRALQGRRAIWVTR